MLTRSTLFPLHAIPVSVLTLCKFFIHSCSRNCASTTGYRAHTQRAVPVTRYSRYCAHRLFHYRVPCSHAARCSPYTLFPFLCLHTTLCKLHTVPVAERHPTDRCPPTATIGHFDLPTHTHTHKSPPYHHNGDWNLVSLMHAIHNIFLELSSPRSVSP